MSTEVVLPESTVASPQILNRSTTKYNTVIEDAYQTKTYRFMYPRVNLGEAYYVGAPTVDTSAPQPTTTTVGSN